MEAPRQFIMHVTLPLALVAVMTVVAACGSVATASPRPSLRVTALGPTLSGMVTTAEDATLTTTFRVPLQIVADRQPTPAPESLGCTAYAAGQAGMFAAPQFEEKIDDHSVYFRGFMTAGYSGPATYKSDTAATLGGTIVVGMGMASGQLPAYTIFRSNIGGSSTLTVKADGSGRFDFSEWGSTEVRGNTGSAASISGTVSWTCG
jgi:hypothetical protein